MSIIRTCRISGIKFTISDFEIALLDKISPTIGGEKFQIPLPTLSPEERRRRRLQFKNYLTLFKRPDSRTGETLISIYPPDSPYIVYSQPYWWSDAWDPKHYRKEIGTTKSIFEQIHAILLSVPVIALDNAYTELENSEYINGNGKSKDCYLVSNGNNNEKCLYCWSVFGSTRILDSNYIRESENCSQSQHLWKCYDIHYGWDASECRHSRYIFSCEGCEYILGGVGLQNQKYQILNTPCTENNFHTTFEKLKTDAKFRKDFEKRVKNLIQSLGLKKSITTGSVESTGDFCYDSKNALNCQNIGDCEDVCNIVDSYDVRDTLDLSQWGNNTTLSYENIAVGLNVSNMYWSMSAWGDAKYNFYSYNSVGCSFIFGCSGLRNQSYCIFNKQYTKEGWEKEIKKIIIQMRNEGTWGEFLDPKYAFYAYNESHAMEKMPLSKSEVEKRGLRWSDRPEVAPEGITKIIPGEKLPDTIEGIPDDVLHWAIKCTKTGKLFQIQPIELEMLRKSGIPLPRIHPIERIKMRFDWDTRVFDFNF